MVRCFNSMTGRPQGGCGDEFAQLGSLPFFLETARGMDQQNMGSREPFHEQAGTVGGRMNS